MKKNKKKKSKFYIIYSGSYFYKPNKDAIDFLNQPYNAVIVKKISQN